MPNSRNYTRRRILSIAIATAASPASVLSLDAGGLSGPFIARRYEIRR